MSSALYSDFGVDVGFAYNRKEAKDHGEGGTLVGAKLEGRKVLIVDDVITAGTAIREAYQELQSAGAHTVGVVIALDRAEVHDLDDRVSAVQAVSRDLNMDVVSIVNLTELQSFLEQSPDYDEATLQSVVDYRKLYGESWVRFGQDYSYQRLLVIFSINTHGASFNSFNFVITVSRGMHRKSLYCYTESTACVF